MRYALISDIHANLPALQAVLDHIGARRDVDATCHLGDLVGYAPWPNETVALLGGFRIAGVAGNYDSTVATDYKHCGCRYEDSRQEELSHLSYDWTRRYVKATTKAVLAALPFRMDLLPEGGHLAGPRVVLVHGTPTLNTLYWTEDRSNEFCLTMARHAGAKSGDVIAFGHTHKPWHREVEGIHFLNTGSVGRPKDGDWRAGYVVLDIRRGAVTSEFVRVEYDLEEAMRGIRGSELPDEFAEYLRTGGQPVPAGRRPRLDLQREPCATAYDGCSPTSADSTCSSRRSPGVSPRPPGCSRKGSRLPRGSPTSWAAPLAGPSAFGSPSGARAPSPWLAPSRGRWTRSPPPSLTCGPATRSLLGAGQSRGRKRKPTGSGRAAVTALFAGSPDPLHVLRWKALYDQLEEAVDASDDVANVLETIAVKHA